MLCLSPKKSGANKNFQTLLLIAMFAFANFSNAAPVEKKKTAPQNPGLLPLEELRTFTRAYDHVRTSYVEEVSDSKMLEYAIKGLISELDPHSAYLDKEAYAELQATTSGEFGGVGLEVGMDEGVIKVITPLDGSPSQKAGIKPGDVVVRIDDQPMKGKTLTDATRLMRGPKDTPIKMSLQRKGVDDPIELIIVRDLIHVQSVVVKPIADDYLYVRIAQFQTNTGKDFVERLRENLKLRPKTKGLVLDLRNNPGGVLQSSVEVADAFLDNGTVVYTQGRMENSSMSYAATPGDLTNGLPLVVLINSGSASASEIVAGALQDHKRAIIMGTRSFGKGSVQTVIPITEDRAIKLTTALYYTPNGRSIQAKGIDPDVRLEKITNGVSQKAPMAEADLAGHIGNKEGQEIGSGTREREAVVNDDTLKDNQVLDAINLLKGLHILGQQPASTNDETDTNKRAPAIAPNIEVRPPAQDK
ncbi:carboxyl-terminal protease [Cellvibrio zantedeschiae]|uniref:Carboxyl-terminal protease n=1 Tax=Cellvibrio zantedeschiae TaxID=1237077 RepID=A0ABQ3BAL7_9GAMM|nr:S41 family peptidase [Cellvibrio zantedeschiae]GGY88305.1 carboxyl-terminal protease [Cellvibrio zantedeschiae]